MFNKPSQQHTAKALSVNEDFWNKIVKPQTFFARPSHPSNLIIIHCAMGARAIPAGTGRLVDSGDD